MQHAERPEGWIEDPAKARVMAEFARPDMDAYCADVERSKTQPERFRESYLAAAARSARTAEEKADRAGEVYDFVIELTSASD